MITRINADQYDCDGCDRSVMVALEGREKTQAPKGWITGEAEVEFDTVAFQVHAMSCLNKGVAAAHARMHEQHHDDVSGSQAEGAGER